MRRFLFLLFLCLLTSVSFGYDSLSTGGLVGWWDFDEDSITAFPDYSGQGATLTSVNSVQLGNPATQLDFGAVPHSAVFNGTTSSRYFQVAKKAAWNSAAFSISVWAKSPDNGAWGGMLVGFGDHTSGGSNIMEFTISAGNQKVVADVATSGVFRWQLISNSSLSTGVWHHIVITFGTGGSTLYVDGAAAAVSYTYGNSSTDYSIDDIYNSISEVDIGRIDITSFLQYHNGFIDDVRFYNKKLSLAEVQTLYTGAEGLTDSSLVAWWKMDGSYGQAFDSSGYGNSGTYVNAAVSSIVPSVGRYNPNSIFLDNSGASTPVTKRYLSVSDSNSLKLTGSALTICAWIYLLDNPRQQGIVEKYDSNGKNGYALRINADGKIQGFTADTVPNYGGVTGNTVLSTGQWYHVAWTFNGSTHFIYLNGVDDSSGGSSSSYQVTTGTNSLKIGARTDALGGTNLFLNGYIDEVKVYNRALTASEIAALASGKYV